MTRTIEWGGIRNARDLGGLPAGHTMTKFGRFVRTPRLDDLPAQGWDAMSASGIRTIVDLRNAEEVAALSIPEGISHHTHPIEDPSDTDFMRQWGERLNDPAYYPASLDLWPHLIVNVFRRFASAEKGGIVFHCSAGRDRTGLIAAMLLQSVGVDEEAIMDDYTESVLAMNDFFAESEAAGVTPRERPLVGEELADWVGRVQANLRDFLRNNSFEHYLLENGLSTDELETIRARFLGPREREDRS